MLRVARRGRKRFAAPDPLRRTSRDLPARSCRRQDLLDPIRDDESDAVVIAEGNVLGCYPMAADARAADRIRGLGFEPRRRHRICAVAPEWKTDLTKLVAVSVEAPDNDAGQPGACCLEHD